MIHKGSLPDSGLRVVYLLSKQTQHDRESEIIA